MCTVTFLPYKEGYILTSNRDEKLTRPSAGMPEVHKKKGYQLAFAKDPIGGGTWIAADDRGNSVCLLNGAFEHHEPRYPYRHSRGLIVLNYFKYLDLEDFTENYNLDKIEPFTLVIVWHNRLFELKWDGEITYSSELPYDQPRIWSSVTLYSQEIIDKRQHWFDKWLTDHPNFTREDILKFHNFEGDENSHANIIMASEDKRRTVSITSILSDGNQVSFRYRDLLEQSSMEHYMTRRS
ncbi:NRDE family protein, partial [Bacteroidota bacterium]